MPDRDWDCDAGRWVEVICPHSEWPEDMSLREFKAAIEQVAKPCSVKFEMTDLTGYSDGWQFADGSLVFPYGDGLEVADVSGAVGGGDHCRVI